jgi:hypothetical protein
MGSILSASCCSIDRRVRRVRREHGQLPSLSAKHVVPQTIRLGTKQIVSCAVDDVPGPFAYLLLELARRPSRIAREKPGPC